MNTRLAYAAVLVTTAAAFGLARPVSAGDAGSFYRMAMSEAAADAAIKGKVEAVLAMERTLHGTDILVDVKGGVILLSGEVDTAGQRDKAGRLASGVEGVKKVMNELMVGEHG
ncbi:BON domain-containing protein [Nitrogeniibacter mangrovi]|uniref:BON domain-containing protein n=1 Tax=Nitrogeniibacter mangrovi TaxID=2016596 RepID=A0A6C1B6S4_9RHOO|nr:BON domain-containing protein [Nitrogeniibacter mangrovi]QID17990.1 BON domain-containing protein [Nitrogeniibacter mangrovi]